MKLLAIEASHAETCNIMALSETFLNHSSNLNELVLQNFKPIECLNRVNQIGGGVALYIRKSIIAHRKKEYEIPNLEALWMELNVGGETALLCVCYRPPGSTVQFWENLESSVDLAKGADIRNIAIVGDLNSDPNSYHGQKLLDFSTRNNLYMNVFEPTRITPTSSTVLDQILSSNSDLVTEVTVEPPISTNDHCTVIALLNLRQKPDKPYKRLIWNYDKADVFNLRSCLSNAKWDDCFVSEDIDSVTMKWTNLLLSIARQFIPNRIITVRPKDKEWYTNDHRRLKRKVLRLFRRAKRLGTDESWNKYKDLHNEYLKNITTSKKSFENNRYKKLQDNCGKKAWWKTVKDLLGHAQDSSVPTINRNGNQISNSECKAQIFNEYFSSHSRIDTSSSELPANNVVANVKLSRISITVKDVYDILCNLKTDKAMGPDGVSPRLLKMCARELAPSLARLINLSLNQGHFPNCWKLANVLPLFKGGNQHEVDNYRPVSLLSCLSKVMERAIFKYVFNFFRENLQISIHQSGFIPGDSTINQLVYLYHYFANALDKNKDVHIVFCDISKAFDKVWHEGLLYKLEKSGIDGLLLEWFKSYLNNRKQRVVINGHHSEWTNIPAGVPQGSVLGPLLFLVYINDITKNIQGNIKLFADDTVLFVDVDHTATAESILNADLARLYEWSQKWLVTFNSKKTKAMNISLKHQPNTGANLFMNNAKLDYVDAHKHLGLNFNSKLNFRSHITSICTKARRQIDMMKRLKYKLDRKSLEQIYVSYVRPTLEYGCVIFDNCDIDCQEMLEKVQVDALKTITGGVKGTSHDALYQEAGFEELSTRRKRQKLLLCHKMIHNTAPQYLCNLVPQLRSEINAYNSRQAKDYEKFPWRLLVFRDSFVPDAFTLWKNLDNSMKGIESYGNFKKALEKGKPKRNDLYYIGNRYENIIHSRLRMKCSALKDHLHKLHVIPSPMCMCQSEAETNKHYFMSCRLYLHQRHRMRMSIENELHYTAGITVDHLLYGQQNRKGDFNEKLFQIVHTYIRETQRFES